MREVIFHLGTAAAAAARAVGIHAFVRGFQEGFPSNSERKDEKLTQVSQMILQAIPAFTALFASRAQQTGETQEPSSGPVDTTPCDTGCEPSVSMLDLERVIELRAQIDAAGPEELARIEAALKHMRPDDPNRSLWAWAHRRTVPFGDPMGAFMQRAFDASGRSWAYASLQVGIAKRALQLHGETPAEPAADQNGAGSSASS